jgi:hypothetical protein
LLQPPPLDFVGDAAGTEDIGERFRNFEIAQETHADLREGLPTRKRGDGLLKAQGD